MIRYCPDELNFGAVPSLRSSRQMFVDFPPGRPDATITITIEQIEPTFAISGIWLYDPEYPLAPASPVGPESGPFALPGRLGMQISVLAKFKEASVESDRTSEGLLKINGNNWMGGEHTLEIALFAMNAEIKIMPANYDAVTVTRKPGEWALAKVLRAQWVSGPEALVHLRLKHDSTHGKIGQPTMAYPIPPHGDKEIHLYVDPSLADGSYPITAIGQTDYGVYRGRPVFGPWFFTGILMEVVTI